MNAKLHHFVFSFLLIFGFSIQASAAHITGGTLTYRYIGDSTNISHHYEVKITLYKTLRYTALGFPSSTPICISSSCFPDLNITANLDPGYTTAGGPLTNYNCGETVSPDFTPIQKATYTNTVILPGVCSDYRFNHSVVCCRIGFSNITNISSYGPNANNIHLMAVLNNTFGNVSSPQFTTDPMESFCVNQNVTLLNTIQDVGQDSIHFQIGQIRSTGSDNCPEEPAFPIAVYASGFSREKPYGMVEDTIQINQSNGNITFTSTGITGSFIKVVTVTRYRYVAADSSYHVVSRIFRETLTSAVGTCSQPTVTSSILSTSSSSPVPNQKVDLVPTDKRVFFMGYTPEDSIIHNPSPTSFAYELPVLDYYCQDSTILIKMANNMAPDNFANTSFQIMGPDTQFVPIQDVSLGNPSASDELIISLAQPFQYNGWHFMLIVQDSANPLQTLCGFRLYPDTMLIAIWAEDCGGFVSTADFKDFRLNPKFFPNPANDELTLVNPASKGRVAYQFIDMRGIRTEEGWLEEAEEKTIDINRLKSGVYILEFILEDGRRFQHRLIKN
ncbi:MAG: T9SS type A sorting domain-containing protein [Cryomorphaceae bacterium]|nr:T9SS type A sorting domain-containing protein [Cryomorphaceae bacterium]